MQILGDGLGGENGKLPQTGDKRRWGRYWSMGKGLLPSYLIFSTSVNFVLFIVLFVVRYVDLDGSTALSCSSRL